MSSDHQRLTAASLRGVWAAVPMFWDERDRFDENTYAANTRRVISAKTHGLYTTGSTGEFYALDEGEFRRMVDLQVELCGPAGMPLQVGCCADATRKVIRLLEYVAAKPAVGAAQVVIPYWMELSDREVSQYFKDITRAVPGLPLVHYNIPRAKRFLQGPDYERLLEVAPGLIGVKYCFAGQHFSALQEAIRRTPQISYFVGEPLLASAMQIGARGSYSSLVMTNPPFMLDLFDAAESGNWETAIQMQRRASEFSADIEQFITKLGEPGSDPAYDKGMAIAAGFFTGSARLRAPYLGWSDECVAAVREWMLAHFPEFIFGHTMSTGPAAANAAGIGSAASARWNKVPRAARSR